MIFIKYTSYTIDMIYSIQSIYVIRMKYTKLFLNTLAELIELALTGIGDHFAALTADLAGGVVENEWRRMLAV